MTLLVLVAVVYMAESGVILHADDNIKEENAVELSENRAPGNSCIAYKKRCKGAWVCCPPYLWISVSGFALHGYICGPRFGSWD